jgi:hypothetical protein
MGLLYFNIRTPCLINVLWIVHISNLSTLSEVRISNLSTYVGLYVQKE